METIRLLIVDDIDDNRLILRSICRKVEGIVIDEAVNGAVAVEKVKTDRPHIVLMDMMMPVMNGLEATRIIKQLSPSTVVMAVTAVGNPDVEAAFADAGVLAYIRKPVDKELIRLKVSSYVRSLQRRVNKPKRLDSLPKVRPFKTLYTLTCEDDVMDFGIWLVDRFDCLMSKGRTDVDKVLETVYAVLRFQLQNDLSTVLMIRENFDEMFIHLPLSADMVSDANLKQTIRNLGSLGQLNDHAIELHLRLPIPPDILEISGISGSSETAAAAIGDGGEPEPCRLESKQHRFLRESFAIKTTAWDYIATIDGDVFEEIRDLQELEPQWQYWIDEIEAAPVPEKFGRLADEVIGNYARAIGNLLEFGGLAYAMVSLAALIRSYAQLLVSDEDKCKNVLMFLTYFKNDLSSWIQHVFEEQDSEDIHYLDASLLSSCMQIETIISGTLFDNGEEGEMVFF